MQHLSSLVPSTAHQQHDPEQFFRLDNTYTLYNSVDSVVIPLGGDNSKCSRAVASRDWRDVEMRNSASHSRRRSGFDQRTLLWFVCSRLRPGPRSSLDAPTVYARPPQSPPRRQVFKMSLSRPILPWRQQNSKIKKCMHFILNFDRKILIGRVCSGGEGSASSQVPKTRS